MDSTDCLGAFNLLTSDLLFDELEKRLPEHRQRLFPPTETLAMFIAQAMSADRSCQHAVNQAAIQRLINGLPQCSTHTGGYCRARQRLPLELISGLACHLGLQIDHQTPTQWRWQGRRVRLVDGTTVTMPDTEENQAAFPQQRGQKPGLGFPICRVVGMTCLSSGALLNAAIGPFNGKGGDEQTLLRSIEGTLDSGDILLGDAFFPTYFFIARMQMQGVDILMEQQGARKRVTDFRRGQSLGSRDHVIRLDKPKIKPDWMSEPVWHAAPEHLTIREFKAGGKIMVTTLMCPKTFTKADLNALYKQRWNVELDIRSIKETMGMNVVSCKTPEMVIKEIWGYLLAYNLIRLLMTQAAILAGILPREISFKHSLQLWLIWSRQTNTSDNHMLWVVCALMAQQRVGNRSGRIEPRAVKRRPKPYPLLVVPRGQAREHVKKYGHPKKLK
ncbi:IS4 family transposase [Methylicorpusculum sp.]|uniref:IS4 family transposase n=1 Tax=Methylicorpusculum sp. TaxID=2713644 RepID=UPI00351F985F